jgi:hypothetical protein
VENGGQRWNEPPLFHPPRSRLGPVSSRSSPLPVDGFGSLSSANGSPKPHPHPLRNLEKDYEKSWDSFIDSSKENEKDVLLSATKPTVQVKNYHSWLHRDGRVWPEDNGQGEVCHRYRR